MKEIQNFWQKPELGNVLLSFDVLSSLMSIQMGSFRDSGRGLKPVLSFNQCKWIQSRRKKSENREKNLCHGVTQNPDSLTCPFLHVDKTYLLWQHLIREFFSWRGNGPGIKVLCFVLFFSVYVLLKKKTVLCFGMSFKYTQLATGDLLMFHYYARKFYHESICQTRHLLDLSLTF